MPAAEKPIAADLKKRDYGRLLTDVSGLVALEEHAKYKATGVAGGFTLSTRLGTAKSDTEVYEKDVEQFVDTGHLHLYRPTPERLASDQKTVFHDVSTLLTTCDVK